MNDRALYIHECIFGYEEHDQNYDDEETSPGLHPREGYFDVEFRLQTSPRSTPTFTLMHHLSGTKFILNTEAQFIVPSINLPSPQALSVPQNCSAGVVSHFSVHRDFETKKHKYVGGFTYVISEITSHPSRSPLGNLPEDSGPFVFVVEGSFDVNRLARNTTYSARFYQKSHNVAADTEFATVIWEVKATE